MGKRARFGSFVFKETGGRYVAPFLLEEFVIENAEVDQVRRRAIEPQILKVSFVFDPRRRVAAQKLREVMGDRTTLVFKVSFPKKYSVEWEGAIRSSSFVFNKQGSGLMLEVIETSVVGEPKFRMFSETGRLAASN